MRLLCSLGHYLLNSCVYSPWRTDVLEIGLSLGPMLDQYYGAQISGFDPKQEVIVNNLAFKLSFQGLNALVGVHTVYIHEELPECFCFCYVGLLQDT